MRMGAGFTVLDTALGDGLSFLRYARKWLVDRADAAVLHYVAIAPAPNSLSPSSALCSELESLMEVAPQSLGAGFHRFLLFDGKVSLTLCMGSVPTMLAEQRMQANEVWIRPIDTAWDKWTLKAVARCCALDAHIHISPELPLDASWLREAGFVAWPKDTKDTGVVPYAQAGYIFRPPWIQHPTASAPKSTLQCAVIGAGLSGASVARVLAMRGWNVTVLEQGDQCAAGASGLPVGLMVPHVSADDAPRSRISRAGTRLMLQHCKDRLNAGQDWLLTGVKERRLADGKDLWHPEAAWVKPARLVESWLNHPRIDVKIQMAVHALRRRGQQWELLDASGHVVCVADHVVCANAIGARSLLMGSVPPQELTTDLLEKLDALHSMFGTLSYGKCRDPQWTDTELADHVHPVNGKGSFAPNIPTEDGLRWYAGSTFEFSAVKLENVAEQQEANRARLERLLPLVGRALNPDFQRAIEDHSKGHIEGPNDNPSDGAQAWTSQRCATHDRLPLVGPVLQDSNCSLWICAGMGSRGLSFSALCAELLVAYMAQEPLPMESTLARSLHTSRHYRGRRSNQRAKEPATETPCSS